jgi:hypothetical protein
MDVSFLENRYYDVILAEMQEFFDQNGFKEAEGIFSNGSKLIKIEYDEAKQIYKLLLSENTQGEEPQFSVISSYLFDDSQNKNDAVSVGIDFVDSAKKAMGIKSGRKAVAAEAELPSGNASHSITVATLTAKLLANYPDYKETYKQEVAAKGKFLYLDFCTTYFVPEIRKTLDSGNKKAIKKLIDMMCEIFVSGDRASVNLVLGLLTSAIGTNADRFKAAADRMGDCPYLVSSLNNEIAILAKNKKLQKALKYQA